LLKNETLKFTNVNIEEYSLDKEIEACVLKLKLEFADIYILAQ
jgi:hypothetical protein